MTSPIDSMYRRIGRLHMGWRHVLFANWSVDPESLRPHVPDALTVDTFDGDAWLSVVPYTNVDVRPPWAPDWFGFALPELNLRTYVTYRDEPGVYFLSLDADGLFGVLGARLFHFLPYYNAAIEFSVEDDTVEFVATRRHPGARSLRFETTYRPTGDPAEPDDGSRAYFLTERYRYYTESPTGRLRYADVDHDPWPLSPVEVTIDERPVFTANGIEPPESTPVYYYSPGVDTLASGSQPAD